MSIDNIKNFIGKIVGSRAAAWLWKYKLHFAFWVLYFIYGYITDQILYGPFYYFSKELLLLVTHPLYLFYAFVFLFIHLSGKSPQRYLTGFLLLIGLISVFFAQRFTLNFWLFPIMDVARGFPKENLKLKQEFVMGSLWIWEFFVKAIAYFFIVKYFKKLKELGKALAENLAQQKALQAKEIEEERARQIESNYKTLEYTFANLVHEIKTPLTLTINCLNEHIEKHSSSYELDLMKISMGKMNKDINNIFDLQRLKLGKEVYDHQQNCDVSGLLEDNLRIFEYYTKRKKIRLKHFITPDLSSLADPAAVNRIINNLVENAIKFSPEDSTISISLTSDENKIYLQVKDQGIGIPEEEVQNVFVPYLQLNKNNIQGMGLGLPLVKSILDGLNGVIEILKNDEAGKEGTTILVSLNKSNGEGTIASYQAEWQDFLLEEEIRLSDCNFDENAPHLLIVEDNKSMNSYLTGKLSKVFNVRFAINGAEAIKRINDRIPDLIISDIMMDTMDGFEMAQILSKNSQLNHVPIIFLSAKNTEKDKLQGIGLGAVDYMEKPFSYPILLKKIESILALKGNQERRLFQNMKDFGRNMLPETTASSNSYIENCKIYLLTNREMEISSKIIAGLKAKDIADELYIAESTVTKHIQNIYEKVGVKSRYELIRKLT
ncbi:ATP-binding protein [Pedobacter steynii]|uniref:histidine kinase n=1 Tax=Pedobacter steynii TaxID=430522 RepID=A0A1D7QN07_9SPHI|nr:ATP-binding protein [Pedobacter steynii]AOM80046.1 hypothetical protein BFS30_24510 [Pedobacter steynii]